MLFFRRTPPINGSVNSKAELKKIKIGGIDQWILVRGKNKDNPILLFLHGGPGSSQIAVASKYQALLEEQFLVVNWDQRGAGMSYSPNLSRAEMTVDRFIEDTRELIEYLTGEYGKEKLYLAGHSWGSLLGALVSYRFPDLILGYIGIGQAVDLQENERLAYDYVFGCAEETNNRKALKQLRRMGEPPYKDILNSTRIRSRWTSSFHGRFYKAGMGKLVLQYLFSSEYSFMDLVRFLRGSIFSYQTMWLEIMDINLLEQVPSLNLPVLFLLGRHDFTTPYEIAVRYFEKLTAPSKEMVWFENSAHCMPFEEADVFQRVILDKLVINPKSGC